MIEEDVLDFLKIRRRWPYRYSDNQQSVEIISPVFGTTAKEFFNVDGMFLYDEWKKYYDLGFTTILSNVLDLNSQLRSLSNKIHQYTGNYINGNFYFSSGSLKHRVSFPSHNHDYHVIVKPIYGKSKWEVSGNKFECSRESFLIPRGEDHEVYECRDKKLSLTLNIT